MIKLFSANGFSAEEKKKLVEAMDLANKMQDSLSFKRRVSTAIFSSTKNNNMKILEDIQKDHWFKASIQSYPWWKVWKRVEVAAETPTGVTFNRAFFKNQSLASLANTISHETMHIAGYSHSSAKDFASVPYQIGQIVEDLGKGYINA